MQNPLRMSKKLPKSDRDIDLPDWADDVTPADEVMKKFYAPTGTFKSGPIAIPAPIPNTSAPATPDETRKDEEKRSIDRDEERADAATREVNTDQKQRESASAPQVSPRAMVTEIEERSATSLPPAALGTERDQSQNIVSEERSTTPLAPDFARETSDTAQSSSFEEFARKWRRYLYPGQLAVMRTLYELTLARGTSECFTQYSQIAAATKMTRRNCINVMNSLVERGFVRRLEVRNDATGKGIRLRIHLDPLS